MVPTDLDLKGRQQQGVNAKVKTPQLSKTIIQTFIQIQISTDTEEAYSAHPFPSPFQEHSPTKLSNISKNLAFGSYLTGAD